MDLTSQAYLATYISTCVMCALLFVYMAARMNRNLGDTMAIKIFRHIVMCAIIVIVAEMACMLIGAAHNAAPRPVIIFANWADLYFSAATVYFMFRFVTLSINPDVQLDKYRPIRILFILPLVALLVLEIMSIKTGWVFFINEQENYERGPYYFIQAAVMFFYCFVAVFNLIYFSVKNPELHQTIAQMTGFLVYPVVGGTLQLFIQGVPFTIIAFTVGTFMLFVSVQAERIETDALTGVYNRNVAKRVLYHKYRNADAEPFYLFIADIDHFKHINDTYGHLQGDRALCVTADALKQVADKYPALFISRYGGDEFLLAMAQNDLTPDALIREIDTALDRCIADAGLAFSFSISVGYSLADSEKRDVARVFDAADRDLYRYKKARKQAKADGGARTVDVMADDVDDGDDQIHFKA